MKKIIQWLLTTKVGQIILKEIIIKYLEKFIAYLKGEAMETPTSFVINNRANIMYYINTIDLNKFIEKVVKSDEL